MVFRGGSPGHDQSRLPPTPVGVPEGSRGASAANPPGPRPTHIDSTLEGCQKARLNTINAGKKRPPEGPPHTAPNRSAQRASHSPSPAQRAGKGLQPRPIAIPRVHAPHSGCRALFGPADRRCRFAQPPAHFTDPYRGRRTVSSSIGSCAALRGHRSEHEPRGQLPRQRIRRMLVRNPQDRT